MAFPFDHHFLGCEPGWTSGPKLQLTFAGVHTGCVPCRLGELMREADPHLPGAQAFAEEELPIRPIYMEVSINGGSPKWMVYKGKSVKNG